MAALEASLAGAMARAASLERGRAALEGRVQAMGEAARAALQRVAAHRAERGEGAEEEEQEEEGASSGRGRRKPKKKSHSTGGGPLQQAAADASAQALLADLEAALASIVAKAEAADAEAEAAQGEEEEEKGGAADDGMLVVPPLSTSAAAATAAADGSQFLLPLSQTLSEPPAEVKKKSKQAVCRDGLLDRRINGDLMAN